MRDSSVFFRFTDLEKNGIKERGEGERERGRFNYHSTNGILRAAG